MRPVVVPVQYLGNAPAPKGPTIFLNMTPARDPKQVFSTNLDNHGREIRKEESWRMNHGAGFLGGIWEAFGKMR